jgi:hypothetical protein
VEKCQNLLRRTRDHGTQFGEMGFPYKIENINYELASRIKIKSKQQTMKTMKTKNEEELMI